MIGIFWKEFIITKDLKLALFFVVLMVVYWLKNKFFKKLVLAIIKRTPTTVDDDLYPLFNQLINISIFGTIIITGLLQFGVNVNAILATAGASSLAIAYALKDTLSNIFAGIMIMADRPFRVNDEIKLSFGETVKVQDIGLRRTRFETLDGERKSILIIPNVDLVKNKVYNYTYAKDLK